MTVSKASEFRRVGPVNLADGISPMNFWTYMYASFICIGVFSAINFAQPYILEVHLEFPADERGKISGFLSLFTEIIGVLLIYPFGILSDRIGRRPVIMIGIILIGIAYALYPFATTANHLYIFRVFFGTGIAAAAAMTSTIVNDYPREDSRGKAIGFSSFFMALGVVGVANLVAQLPYILTEQGLDPILAGRLAFGSAAFLCFVSVAAFYFGLKGGTPGKRDERLPYSRLIASGLRSAKNPRIALSYASAFTARSDVVIAGVFFSLWANVAAASADNLNTAEALSLAGISFAIIQISGMVWSVIFGFIMDRINRMTAMIIALAIAGSGYLSMGLITSPFDLQMFPAFVVLGAGMAGAMMSSVALLGQESNDEERGTVFGMNGLCGNAGIVVAAAVGGTLFDLWAPYAPFVLIGAAQMLLLIVAIIIRVVAPGPILLGQTYELDDDTSGAAVSVVLVSAGDNPSGVVRALRTVTGMLPHEARDLVDGAPGQIGERIPKHKADTIKQALEAVGATVQVS
jgi:MFS family permease